MSIKTWDDLNAKQKNAVRTAYWEGIQGGKVDSRDIPGATAAFLIKHGLMIRPQPDSGTYYMPYQLTPAGQALYESANPIKLNGLDTADNSGGHTPPSLKEDEEWLVYVEPKHSAEKPLQIVLTENMNQVHQAGVKMREEIARLQAENERLRAELDVAKHELEARRSILEMAVSLKQELLPARAGNGWIDSIEQLGQMARDERERADAYLNHLVDIRDAAMKPQDALAGEWLAATVSSPSSVVDLVKARMEQVEKMRETLKDIADGTRGIPPSNYQESTRFWQSRHNLLVGIAQDALRELDKAK